MTSTKFTSPTNLDEDVKLWGGVTVSWSKDYGERAEEEATENRGIPLHKRDRPSRSLPRRGGTSGPQVWSPRLPICQIALMRNGQVIQTLDYSSGQRAASFPRPPARVPPRT